MLSVVQMQLTRILRLNSYIYVFEFCLFSVGRMPDWFYLPFNSALCAFAHFSFGFALTSGNELLFSPHEAAGMSFLAKKSPATAGGTSEAVAQPVHLHRHGLTDVTLGELRLSCSSSSFPLWPAISSVPIPPGVFGCKQQTRAGLLPPQPFMGCPSLPLIPAAPVVAIKNVTLCSLALCQGQLLLPSLRADDIKGALSHDSRASNPCWNPQFPQSCQQPTMGGTLRERTHKNNEGQPPPAIKTPQAGHGWRAKTKAGCHRGAARPAKRHQASRGTACLQAQRFPPCFIFWMETTVFPALILRMGENCPFRGRPTDLIAIHKTAKWQPLLQH